MVLSEVMVKLDQVFTPSGTLIALLMMGSVMSTKASDGGWAPWADHVIVQVVQVLLDGTFIHEVSITFCAIVMRG
jgi:hypothetical protein